MTSKKIDLGEYVITIYYDDVTGKLEIKVFDEGGDMIERLNVDEDDDIEDKKKPDINMN